MANEYANVLFFCNVVSETERSRETAGRRRETSA